MTHRTEIFQNMPGKEFLNFINKLTHLGTADLEAIHAEAEHKIKIGIHNLQDLDTFEITQAILRHRPDNRP